MDDERTTDAARRGQDETRRRERALGRATRIMIVDDDDPGMRTLVENALKEAPGRYEVVAECEDGAEAIETGRAVHPEVVLLDLEMPRMGGLETLPKLKDALPDARFVIVSGSCTEEDFEQARKRGAVACLTKGVAFTQLIDCLDTVLKQDLVDPECLPVFR